MGVDRVLAYLNIVHEELSACSFHGVWGRNLKIFSSQDLNLETVLTENYDTTNAVAVLVTCTAVL